MSHPHPALYFELQPSQCLKKLTYLLTLTASLFMLCTSIHWLLKLIIISLFLSIPYYPKKQALAGLSINDWGVAKVWGKTGKALDSRLALKLCHPYFIWFEVKPINRKKTTLPRYSVIFYDQLSQQDFKKLRAHFIHFYH